MVLRLFGRIRRRSLEAVAESGPLRLSRSWFDAGAQSLGCGMTVVIVVICTIGGAFLDNFLVARARVDCGLGGSASGALDLPQRWELTGFLATRLIWFPIVSVLSGCLSLAVNPLALWSPLGRSRIARFALVIGAVVVSVMGPVLLVVHDFATIGTPSGHAVGSYVGDGGPCRPGNVPPWWPSWLPS